MRAFFWYFIWYSFLGFLLEVVFARATGHPKRDRKCLLLLPLCPVYGVGGIMILALTEGGGGPLWVMAAGFGAATAAELVLGGIYRYGLRVEFWDYRHLPFNLGGLVCLRFSLYWTGLALILVYVIHPGVAALTAALPPAMDPPAVVLLGADCLVSSVALRRERTTEVLCWYRR